MACAVNCTISGTTASSNCTYDVTIPTIPANTPDINIPTVGTITEESVDGKGVFDIYMRAGMNQLMTQYNAGRIKGADFATAYVAQTQLMMTEANKFVLGLVQAEIAASMFALQYVTAGYDASLKEQQAAKTKAETDLLCQQIAELKANGKEERALKQSQKQTQIKQAELYARQITGFGEKAANDAAKTAFDAWAVHAVEEPVSSTYGTVYMNPTAPKSAIDKLMKKV